jgi:hypothetical protein
MKNTADVTGGKPVAVLLQSISGVSAINLYSPFTTFMEERERCYSFVLSRTPHETLLIIFVFDIIVNFLRQSQNHGE